ncbi:hypothetical protein FF1_035336 [Malus domestica]
MSSSSTTSVHVTALDGLVNVNSLFTIAVFVGLSLATPGQRSVENRTSCDAGIDVAKKLLAFGSVMGCMFLMLSMVNVIQIRLGMLSYGSKSAVHAVAALVVLVTTALLNNGMSVAVFSVNCTDSVAEKFFVRDFR